MLNSYPFQIKLFGGPFDGETREAWILSSSVRFEGMGEFSGSYVPCKEKSTKKYKALIYTEETESCPSES